MHFSVISFNLGHGKSMVIDDCSSINIGYEHQTPHHTDRCSKYHRANFVKIGPGVSKELLLEEIPIMDLKKELLGVKPGVNNINKYLREYQMFHFF